MAHEDDDIPTPPHPHHLNGGANGKLSHALRDSVRSASDEDRAAPLSERLMDLIRRIRKMPSDD